MRAVRAILGTFVAWLPMSATADMINSDELPPYEICALCHGLDGVSAMAKFPKLAGQPHLYLEKQIRDFLKGHRENDGGQMAAIVTEITEDDIPIAAKWFSSKPSPVPAEKGPLHAKGEALFTRMGCDTCHVGGKAQSPLIPYLRAQHAGYLGKQMSDFKAGRRANDAGGNMQKRMSALSKDEIDAIASYLAATPRPTGLNQ